MKISFFRVMIGRGNSTLVVIKYHQSNLYSIFAFSHVLKYFFVFCREWKFEHQEHMSNISTPIALRMKETNPMSYSVRLVRVGEKSLFSRDVLYSLVITNVLSILIGAGIG